MKLTDEFFMSKAIDLARLGQKAVAPNPMVGALIVKNNEIISSGYHHYYGGPHAEVDAISKLTDDEIRGSTLYCSLEPCCHTNKQTPPCTQLIISKGIKRVVCAVNDPNPQVNSRGLEILSQAGIEVVTNILSKEATELNAIFFTAMIKKRPYVHLKWAMSLDGKLATTNGDSKWITNELARQEAHKLRGLNQAVLVGTGTLKADNPALNVRFGLGELGYLQPERVVIGSLKNISGEEQIFHTSDPQKTWLFTYDDDEIKMKKLLQKGVHLYAYPSGESELIQKMLQVLFENKIISLFVEGGPRLLSSFLHFNLYDAVTVFIAPILIGKGMMPYNDELISVASAKVLKNVQSFQLGDNLCFHAKSDRHV